MDDTGHLPPDPLGKRGFMADHARQEKTAVPLAPGSRAGVVGPGAHGPRVRTSGDEVPTRDPQPGPGHDFSRVRVRSESPADGLTTREHGRPLDASVRGFFEHRLGTDLSAVRVHDDRDAAASARRLHAVAVTVGPHVLAGRAGIDRDPQYRHVLAHELTHVVQHRSPASTSTSVAQAEREADAATQELAVGRRVDVRESVAPRTPLCQTTDREDEVRRARGSTRTRLFPDLGRVTGRQRRPEGTRGLPLSRADTEKRLQDQIPGMRSRIPVFTDLAGMGEFDSDFYGDPGRFDFRGHVMAGWEVNYYFISMAMAHQGWDWNEAQAIIWAWNKSQGAGVNPYGGGGDMTPEMWFAAEEGFRDEQDRLAAEARPPAARTTPPVPVTP